MTGPLIDAKYVILPYRVGRLDDKFLVTIESGGWAVLDKKQFRHLQANTVEDDSVLFSVLKDASVVVIKAELQTASDNLRKRLWYLGNGPSLHVVAVTGVCNFACKYCYAEGGVERHMSQETAKKVAEFIMKSPAKTVIVEFSGGEPLLNFPALKTVVLDSKRLAEKLGKKVGFAMINNGSSWSDEKLDFFREHNIGICFSLDGPKDLHDRHRPYRTGGGTYDYITKWIKKIRSEGYPGLQALPVITKYTLSRGRDLLDEYMSYGFRILRFKYLGYFGRASELWGEIGYGPEEFLEAWKDIIEYMFELNSRGVHVREGLATVIAKKLFRILDPGYCELQMPCGAGLNQIAYAPDGGIYTCDEGRMFDEFRLGDVTQNYSEVLKNATLNSMLITSSGFFNICDNCELKPFCGVCPVESYRQQGDIESKIVFDRRHVIHSEMIRYLIKRSEEDQGFKKMLLSWTKPLDNRALLSAVTGD